MAPLHRESLGCLRPLTRPRAASTRSTPGDQDSTPLPRASHPVVVDLFFPYSLSLASPGSSPRNPPHHPTHPPPLPANRLLNGSSTSTASAALAQSASPGHGLLASAALHPGRGSPHRPFLNSSQQMSKLAQSTPTRCRQRTALATATRLFFCFSLWRLFRSSASTHAAPHFPVILSCAFQIDPSTGSLVIWPGSASEPPSPLAISRPTCLENK